MRAMLKSVVPLLVLATAACEAPATDGEEMPPPAETTAMDESAVRSELEGRLDAYEQAAVAGEVATMKDLWTEDAHLLEPGMNMSGAEVAAFYDATFAEGGASVESIDIRIAEVFVHDDVAYTIGDYDEVVTPTADAEPTSVHNNWMGRWERGPDGTWKIDRLVVGSVEAPEGM